MKPRPALIEMLKTRLRDGGDPDKAKDEAFALHPGVTSKEMDQAMLEAVRELADQWKRLLNYEGTKQ